MILSFLKRLRESNALRMSTTTGFFRNVAQLEVIGGLVPNPQLVYVLGCSRGCEAYSLAMFYINRLSSKPFAIRGFDVDSECIDAARAGKYKSEEVHYYGEAHASANLFETLLKKSEKGEWLVDEAIKKHCKFEVASVLDGNALKDKAPADVVLCQNVLVHMSDSECETALSNLKKWTKPNGYILLGGVRPDIRARLTKKLGLTPVLDGIAEIHDSWRDLRGWYKSSPWWGRKYYFLEPIKRGHDWEYRYSTIFRK